MAEDDTLWRTSGSRGVLQQRDRIAVSELMAILLRNHREENQTDHDAEGVLRGRLLVKFAGVDLTKRSKLIESDESTRARLENVADLG